jgi:hypothetical protein
VSDDERTPQGTARINSERFDTELAAVWYAANYYYEASFRRGGEYIGVVFRDADGRYGLTVRSDGGFSGAKVRVFDVPHGTVPTAVWHTHVPYTSGKADPLERVFLLLMTTFDLGWDEFSGGDRMLAENATQISRRAWGHSIAIYLVTASLIRRYRPGARIPEKSWPKAMPSGMTGT